MPNLVDYWDFQKDLINDPSQRIAVCWARGNGKSFCIASKIALEIFANEARSKPSNWLVVSASRDQAKEALEKIADMSKVIYAVAERMEVEQDTATTPDGKERYTIYRLRLGSATTVIGVAASPKAVRGYTSNIWWDEACFFDDDQEMYEALKHCTRGKLKMIVSSTPWGGESRRFYELLNDETVIDNKPLWSKHFADIYRAVRDGRDFNIEVERASSKPEYWAREMELQWIDDARIWFDSELLDSCESNLASVSGRGYSDGQTFIGNDIGLRGDLWCAWVLECVGDLLITREVVTLEKSTFKDHDREIDRLWRKYLPTRLCVDQGGMGERTVEELKTRYGSSRVEGIIFNTNNKGAMATLGKELMEKRRLLLPKNQPEIRKDLRKLQKVVSLSGNVRFQAERDKDGHADRCWAMLLACNAAITPYQPISFKSTEKIDDFAGFLL